MYSKSSKGPNINPWRTVQSMVPTSKQTVLNVVKKTLFSDKSQTILLFYLTIFYLKLLSRSFWLVKFFDPGCKKYFEDWLKLYAYVFPFRLKSC